MTWRSVLAVGVALSVSVPAFAQTDTSDPPDRQTAQPRLFRKLIVTLGRDLKKLPSRANAPVLLNGAILAAAAYPSTKSRRRVPRLRRC